MKKRIEVCGHAIHAGALVLGVKFCVCRECGHMWTEWPLNEARSNK